MTMPFLEARNIRVKDINEEEQTEIEKKHDLAYIKLNGSMGLWLMELV